MGGGQGMSKIGQESDRALAEISMQLYNSTKGIRGETIQQLTEGLMTSNITERLPEIQQGIESSMAQQAGEQTQLSEAAATTGQARTPYAIKQRAQAQLGAEARTALVPSDYIQSIIRTSEPILYGQAPGIALEGLGSLANIGASQRIDAQNADSAAISSIIGGAGQAAAAGAVAYLTPSGAPNIPPPPTSTGLYV